MPVLDAQDRRVPAARTVNGTAYEVWSYRPRIEGLFARIERWVDTARGLSHWRSISRDNVTTLYGLDASSSPYARAGSPIPTTRARSSPISSAAHGTTRATSRFTTTSPMTAGASTSRPPTRPIAPSPAARPGATSSRSVTATSSLISRRGNRMIPRRRCPPTGYSRWYSTTAITLRPRRSPHPINSGRSRRRPCLRPTRRGRSGRTRSRPTAPASRSGPIAGSPGSSSSTTSRANRASRRTARSVRWISPIRISRCPRTRGIPSTRSSARSRRPATRATGPAISSDHCRPWISPTASRRSSPTC